MPDGAAAYQACYRLHESVQATLISTKSFNLHRGGNGRKSPEHR